MIRVLLVLLLTHLTVALTASIPATAQTARPQIEETLQDTLQNEVQRQGVIKRVLNYFANSNKKHDKKFNMSIIGGPHYSNESSFAIGFGAEGIYRAAADTALRYSTATLTSNVSVLGCVEMRLRNNLFFDRNKWRSYANLRLALLPRYIWGFGFDNAEEADNKSEYTLNFIRFNVNLLRELADNLYIGPTLSYEFNMGRKFESSRFWEIDRISRSYGIGVTMEFDSRDLPTNATKGVLINISQTNYTGFDTKPYFRTVLIADWFKRLGPSTVLATDFYAMLNYGTVPWQMYAQMGGSHRMRGYYEGRYTDNNMITFQAELRQKIYRRIGMTAWVGAGNVYGDNNSFCWRHTLPNWGVGFRWEFMKNVNIRLDYGMGKRMQSGFNFGLEEAF